MWPCLDVKCPMELHEVTLVPGNARGTGFKGRELYLVPGCQEEDENLPQGRNRR